MKINFNTVQLKYPKQEDLISIIVPIYNKECYLRNCLNSILAQTYKNWEALLVNDGSTDNSKSIIDEYSKIDSRFIAINKKNEGTLLARKTGLENSKGEFIASLDSDDMYHPQFLEKMFLKIIETNADFVYCKINADNKKNIFNVSDYKWKKDFSKNIIMILEKKEGSMCYLWNKLIKRQIYEKVNFPDAHLTLGEDPVQILQITYHSSSAMFIKDELYFYDNEIGVSVYFKPINKVKEILYIYKTLLYIYKGNIPLDIYEAFLNNMAKNFLYYYFFLSNDQRNEYKYEFKPVVKELLQKKQKGIMKMFYILAFYGIRLPFLFLEIYIKPLFKKYFR